MFPAATAGSADDDLDEPVSELDLLLQSVPTRLVSSSGYVDGWDVLDGLTMATAQELGAAMINAPGLWVKQVDQCVYQGPGRQACPKAALAATSLVRAETALGHTVPFRHVHARTTLATPCATI